MKLLDTTEEVIDEEELLLLLDEEVITTEIKVELIKYFKSSIRINFKTYPEEIIELIISEYFNEEDLEYLINNYSSFTKKVKSNIVEAIIIHIDKVLDEITSDEIEEDLLIEILKRDEIELEKKMSLLYSLLDNLNEIEIQRYLMIMKNDVFLSLFNGKRPKVEKNQINFDYLNYFKDKGWITSFVEEPNDKNYYRAFGTRI